ncbi:hypothetical protein D3C71_1349720 [compost metagenome]
MFNTIALVRDYSKLIKNGRTQRSISAHMRGEHDELDIEIEKVEQGLSEGPDGIVGENIDIIACALDSIFEHAPDITDEEIYNIMDRKCRKWVEKYGNPKVSE